MRRIASLAVLVFGAIGFTGCGGGASDTTTADAGAGASAPAAPGGPPSSPSATSSSGSATDATDEMAAPDGPSYPSSGPGAPGSSSLPGYDGGADAYPDESNYTGAADPSAAGVDTASLGEGYAGAEAYPDSGAGANLGADDTYSEGYPGGPGMSGGRRAEAPKDYAGKAELAFREGRDLDAINYHYAHGLASETGPADNLQRIKWVSGLKRPAMAVRWGIGIEYTAPKNYEGDPYAVGKDQNLPQRRGRGRQSGNRGGGETDYGGADAGLSTDTGEIGDYGGGGGGRGENATIKKYTGELGEKLIERLEEHIGKGAFGDVLATALEGKAGGGGRGGAAGIGGDEYSAYPDGPGAFPGSGGPRGGPRKDRETADRPQQLAPGVVLLGLGEQKELLLKSKDQELDLLILFEVNVRPNPRTRLIENKTRLYIYDVATNERLERSSEINNVQVQHKRQEDDDDGVDEEYDDLFKVIDESYVAGPLPDGIKPEHVRGRVETLTASKYRNPLRVLNEIQFYNQAKLIDDTQLANAFIALIGKDPARALVRGTEDEKKDVLKQWLPKEPDPPPTPARGPGDPARNGRGPRDAADSTGLESDEIVDDYSDDEKKPVNETDEIVDDYSDDN